MKRDLIDIAPSAESLTTIQTHLTTIATECSFLVGLDEDQRTRLARLGLRNETFSLQVIETARQNPGAVPALIDLAGLLRDVDAREKLLPILIQMQTLTTLLEDTMILLGVDIYNGARAIYKTLQVVGDANGLSEILADLGKRFEKKSKQTETPGSSPTNPTGTTSTNS
jgi:hypothetical protein